MLRIWAWTETSRALVGSSSTISSGRRASARAIPIRWRCPPENSWGKRQRCSGLRPTSWSSSATRWYRCARVPDVMDLERFGDDVADQHPRAQRAERVLEDDLELRPDLGQALPALAVDGVLVGDLVELGQELGGLGRGRLGYSVVGQRHRAELAVDLLESVESRRGRPVERLSRRGLDEAEQQPPDRGLAAAGLADEPYGLAFVDVEADPVHGANVADARGEDAPADREELTDVARRKYLPEVPLASLRAPLPEVTPQRLVPCINNRRRCAPSLPWWSEGVSVLQMGIAWGQRGWNRQPEGGVMRFGTDPGIDVSSLSGWSSRGMEASSPWV